MIVFIAGCADKEAAQRAEAHTRFTDAVDLVSAADQGYVPAGSDKAADLNTNLETFRQNKLKEAAAQLEPVISSGTTEQKLAARQLLADIKSSHARVILRSGMNEWADLANESASLLTVLAAIDSANARAISLDISDEPLLKKLNEDQIVTRRRLVELQESRSALTQRVAELKTAMADLNKQSEAALVESRAFTDKAFPLSGDQRYELYEKASQAERKSSKLASEADKRGVNLDVYESELEIIDSQIASAERFLKSIASQIDDVKIRGDNRVKSFNEAEAERDELIRQLDADVDDLARRFDDKVDRQLAEALADIDRSIELMNRAVADSQNSRDVQIELLAKMMTRVHILTSHIMVISDLGRTLNVIAVRAADEKHPLMTEQRSRFKSVIARISQRQSQIIGQAIYDIDTANDLALQLAQGASETDAIATVANSYAGDLSRYRNRINELRLAGIPERGTPFTPEDASSSTTTASETPVDNIDTPVPTAE